MKKVSIKRKLLLYFIIIQTIVIFTFGYAIYVTFKLTSEDKLKSNLRVIILDIRDEVFDHINNIEDIPLDEEHEYEFKPLDISILKINNQIQEINLVKNNIKNKRINFDYDYIKSLEFDKIIFKIENNNIFSLLKISVDKSEHLIELRTSYRAIDKSLENIFFILLFLTPIIIVLSLLGGNFLITKSFLSIKELLINIKNINTDNLTKRIDTNNSKDEIDALSIEVNKLLDRVEEAFNKSLQFSSDASHELKTPLTIIKGEIEVTLRKDRTNIEYKEKLNSILNEIDNIQKIIEELLFLSKTDDELRKTKFEEVYLDEILSESIFELKAIAKENNIKIELEIKDPISIFGNSVLLKIMMKNLLLNAIKYSHNSSKILIILSQKALSIEDYGIGIAQKDIPFIFDKFYRADKSRAKNSGGTGLGMAIVKRIITLHNINIEINSKENIGTNIQLVFNK